MVAVAENLNGIKDIGIRSKYATIFEQVTDLTKQRNILTHQYGHAEKTVDWAKVWTVIQDEYPKLEAAVAEAIKELETI